jgi:hypothetical protein
MFVAFDFSFNFDHCRWKQLVSLTLRILKSLYPWVDLDTAGEGFVVTCSDEEAFKHVDDSAMTSGKIIDMLGVDMSHG